MPLEPGDDAPDFTLLDQDGATFSLSTSLEERKAPHLLYFFPRADTPGCTKQSCGLRDVADRIGDTAIVGISPDPPAKLAKFAVKHGLGFTLLADQDHAVAEAYDSWGEKSMYGRRYMGIIRSAFLVGPDGRVVHAWYKVSPKDTPRNLVAALG